MHVDENPLQDLFNAIDDNQKTLTKFLAWENHIDKIGSVTDAAPKCRADLENEAKSITGSAMIKALLVQKTNNCMANMARTVGDILIKQFGEAYKYQMATHGYASWFGGIFDMSGCNRKFTNAISAMSAHTAALYQIDFSDVAKALHECKSELTEDLENVSLAFAYKLLQQVYSHLFFDI